MTDFVNYETAVTNKKITYFKGPSHCEAELYAVACAANLVLATIA